MAEASAKMALREYVRADDIDLAIEVAVGSFVSAQKLSIKKTLQRVRFFCCKFLFSNCGFCNRASENTSPNRRIMKNSWHSYSEA